MDGGGIKKRRQENDVGVGVGQSDTPLTVTLNPRPEGVTVSGEVCIE